ncbi:MAG: M23 family metallopeptidase [Planctomycetia bacterium]|nr:M23 family metallopeptidase [Planctomycetia bacterium]
MNHRIRIVATALLLLAPAGVAVAQDSNRFVQVTAHDRKDGGDIEAVNQSLAPITLTLNVTLENMQADKEMPLTVVLKPRSTTQLVSLRQETTPDKYRYTYKFNTKYGDCESAHDDDHVYQLPFEAGRTYRVIQGYGGKFSHQGEEANSLDFDLAAGDKVLAAREGIVVDTEASHAQGGKDPKLKNESNYVLVLHDDGTLGCYVHLKKNGVKVAVGTKVAAGTLLGLSGNTGYSSRPHLHFDVYRPLDGEKSERIKTKFKTTEHEAEMLEEGKTYTRP